eukprot:11768473-Ditylum_brightwellii.AAC.1
MATCILNPYTWDIDISNKEGRKLYAAGCVEVEKEQRFNGLKEKFSDFLKMIEDQTNDLQMIEILDVLVSWDASKPAPQNPSKVVNIFESQGITHDQ